MQLDICSIGRGKFCDEFNAILFVGGQLPIMRIEGIKQYASPSIRGKIRVIVSMFVRQEWLRTIWK